MVFFMSVDGIVPVLPSSSHSKPSTDVETRRSRPNVGGVLAEASHSSLHSTTALPKAVLNEAPCGGPSSFFRLTQPIGHGESSTSTPDGVERFVRAGRLVPT